MSTAIQNATGETVATIADSEPVPVHAAWSAVMNEITVLTKSERNAQQGFNFRGIDNVMNALGPVLRKHGVFILPICKKVTGRDFTTSKGTLMHEVHVEVDFAIYGPDGTCIIGSAPGESADSGDKATPKAMSVAFRTFLLQALCLPTDEPDPDSESVQRAPVNTKAQDAATVATGLLKPDVTLDAVQRVKVWAEGKKVMDEMVVDAEGNSLPLGRLFQNVEEALGGDNAAEAEKVLQDSLGARTIDDPLPGGKIKEDEDSPRGKASDNKEEKA